MKIIISKFSYQFKPNATHVIVLGFPSRWGVHEILSWQQSHIMPLNRRKIMRKSPTLVGNKWSLIYIYIYNIDIYIYPLQKICRPSCWNLVYNHGSIWNHRIMLLIWISSYSLYFINLKCLFLLEETPLLKLPDRFQYKMKGFSLKVGSILLDVTSLCASYKASETFDDPHVLQKGDTPVANAMLSQTRWSKHCTWPPKHRFARPKDLNFMLHLSHAPW